MERHLKHLNKTQLGFIDLIYIQLKTFKEVSEALNVDITTIRKLNIDLDSTWRPITRVRDKWKLKEIGGDFWDFYDWVMTTEKRCHYCGITQAELGKLHEIGITNKRPTRGRVLELDRKRANEPYSNIQNLTYSCYWCNNAKTDTFSEEEFLIIGKAIAEVWKQRLFKFND